MGKRNNKQEAHASAEGKYNLLELIDINILKRFQDVIYRTYKVSTGIADLNGVSLIAHESWTEFCGGNIKACSRGRKACEKCDKQGMMSALESGKAVVYTCHAGLSDFAVPIIIDGEPVGCFLGGQVAASPLRRPEVARVARRYDIDEDSLWEASRTIQVVSEDQLRKIADITYEVMNVTSEMAYQKYLLYESNLEVQKAAKMKSDFLANMSHEIRTPMNAVIGMAEMTLREKLTPAARDFVHQIITSGKGLLTIINDILDFSKIESGRMDIHEEEYEPLSIINDVVNIIVTRIGEKPLELLIDVDKNIPSRLMGDPIRIKQIIVNLSNNAVKFTESGKVALRLGFTVKSGNMIELQGAVEDTGSGIKKNDIDNLFDNFFRVDSKKDRSIEGTGLGLPITKQIVALMGGSINVSSIYGAGSTFSFRIPQKVMEMSQSIRLKEKSQIVYAAILNKYVREQLIQDIQRFGAVYRDLPDDGRLSCEDGSFIFVEQELLTEAIEDFVEQHPRVTGVLLMDFRADDTYNLEHFRVVKKPLYALNIAMILNHEDIHNDVLDESEGYIEFIAPEAEILIVDDNNVNLTVAEGLLKPLEMKIDKAGSGQEALDMIVRKHYDLVFMDHMMPKMDGVETTRLIRRFHSDYKNVPIIALTANAVMGTKEMFLREGMNDFVAKPIEMPVILSKLKYWLPAEKIKKAAVVSQPSGEETEPPQIQIEGLDIEYAMKLLGSESLFWVVLKDYYDVIEKKASAIKEKEMEEDWKGYTVEVHALKSSSRQIGAIELSDMAAELEKAGHEGDIEKIREGTDALLNLYCDYISRLKPYIKEEEEEVAPTKGVMPKNERNKVFDRMQTALEDLDIDKMVEELENVRLYEWSPEALEKIKGISDAAADFDIERCEELLGEWVKGVL